MYYIGICDDEKEICVFLAKCIGRLYPEADLFLIIGADQIINFEKWYRYSDIKNYRLQTMHIEKNPSVMKLIRKAAKEPRYFWNAARVRAAPFREGSR